MSQMSTVPVFACRVCRQPVYVTKLTTFVDDPDGKLLASLMKALADVALCDYHKAMRNWYASQGRESEFLANALNPNVVLYNVHDHTGVGWYGKAEAQNGTKN